MSRKVVLPVLLLAIACVAALLHTDSMAGFSKVGAAATAPPVADEKEFMQSKLAALNRSMGAVAIDDFAAIERSGKELIDLSKQESWQQRSSPAYLQDTADFVAAAEYLIRAAGANDPQAVAHGYTAVVHSCLNCHRRVRTPKVAANQAIQPSAPHTAVRRFAQRKYSQNLEIATKPVSVESRLNG